MAKVLICPDVSSYQRALDGTFTRDFLIMRVTHGAHFLDPNFLANASAAKKLYDQGRISGVVLYTVFTADPVKAQFDAVWQAIGPKTPDWLAGIMIDVEAWRGTSYSLAGDHSKAINQLYGLHAHRMGHWSSVLAYGNQGDLAELYPHRDSRCKVIVASYGSRLVYKNVKGAIGQQYTDGQTKWSAPAVGGVTLPRSSSPFGACDHNVFPEFPNGKALRALLRPSVPAKPGPPVVTPPTPPTPTPPTPPAPLYYPAGARYTRSPHGGYGVFPQDDGTVQLRHKGVHVADLMLRKVGG